jgi:hypothetical protein
MNLFETLQKANADLTNDVNELRASTNNPNPCYPCDDKAATIFEDVRDNCIYLMIGHHHITVMADGTILHNAPELNGPQRVDPFN